MASYKNDSLLERSVDGSTNYYNNHKCIGTAGEKGLAARISGHSYDILTGKRDDTYFSKLRHSEHYIDEQGRHNSHFVGERRKKFPPQRSRVTDCLQASWSCRREDEEQGRRDMMASAQTENLQSWGGFRERTAGLSAPRKKTYTIDNAKFAHEAEKLRPRMSSKQDWLEQRVSGSRMTRSISAPSLELTDRARSLRRAMNADPRKAAHQSLTESAPCLGTTSTQLHRLSSEQLHCSVSRVENSDFAITRKNNHYSSQDKLTRCDPFYMRPRNAIQNGGVKYNIISNERRWFRY